MAREYPTVLDLVGHTPLARLQRIVPDDAATVLAKLEYIGPGGSVKDRIGIKLIEAAEWEVEAGVDVTRLRRRKPCRSSTDARRNGMDTDPGWRSGASRSRAAVAPPSRSTRYPRSRCGRLDHSLSSKQLSPAGR
jgi:hypothetical protein